MQATATGYMTEADPTLYANLKEFVDARKKILQKQVNVTASSKISDIDVSTLVGEFACAGLAAAPRKHSSLVLLTL